MGWSFVSCCFQADAQRQEPAKVPDTTDCSNHRVCTASTELPWNQHGSTFLLTGLAAPGPSSKGSGNMAKKHTMQSIQSKDSSAMPSSRGTTGLDSDGWNAQSSVHVSSAHASSDPKNSRTANVEEPQTMFGRSSVPADAGPHPEIDSVLKLLMRYLDLPLTAVTVFHDATVIVKDGEEPTRNEPLSKWPMCGWARLAGEPPSATLLVPDVRCDARFSKHLPMHLPGGQLRFFGVVPLVSPGGVHLGAICLCDVRERHVDAAQESVLANLASMVLRHVAKEAQLRLVQQQHDELVPAMLAVLNAHRHLHQNSGHEHCVLLVDAAVPGFQVLYVNGDWEKLTDTKSGGVTGCTLRSLLQDSLGAPVPRPQHEEAAQQGRQFDVGDVVLRAQPAENVFTLLFRPTCRASSSDDKDGPPESASPACPYIVTMNLQPRCSSTSASTSASAMASATPNSSGPSRLPPAASQPMSSATVSPAHSMSLSSPLLSYLPLSKRLSKQVDSACDVIEDLELGQEIGLGSVGHVYCGKWFGSPVAVKVVDVKGERQAELVAGPLEALLSQELRHPHITSILRWAIARPALQTQPVPPQQQQQQSEPLPHQQQLPGPVPPQQLQSDPLPQQQQQQQQQQRPGGGCCWQDSAGMLDGTGALLEADSGPLTACEPMESSVGRGSRGNAMLARASLPAGIEFYSSISVAGAGDADGSSACTDSGAGAQRSALGSQPTAQSTGEKGPAWAVIDLTQAGEDMDDLLRGESSELAAPYRVVPRAPMPGRAVSLRGPGAFGPGPRLLESRFLRPNSGGFSPQKAPSRHVLHEVPPGCADRRRCGPGCEPPIGGNGAGSGGILPGWHGTMQAQRTGARTSLWSLPEDARLSDSSTPRAAPPALRLWVVVEHMDRGSLETALSQGLLYEVQADGQRRPNLKALLATALEVASALSCLHGQGIVHGDLCARNVLLSSQGPTAATGRRGFNSKVAYAGLARVLGAHHSFAGQGKSREMAPHLAPELQAMRAAFKGAVGDGERESAGAVAAVLATCGPAQDVYSFGYLMWQLYAVSNNAAGMQCSGSVEFSFPAWAHADYAQLALACLAADPMRRPRADAVCARLQQMQEDV